MTSMDVTSTRHGTSVVNMRGAQAPSARRPPPSAAPAIDVEGTLQRSTAHLETEDHHATWALFYGLAAMASFIAACLGYRLRALSLPCALLVLLASAVALGLCRRHLDSPPRRRGNA